MNIYITLDYELFFGAQSGSVQQSIIKPTEALLRITDEFGIRLTFFVDSGFLLALEKYKSRFKNLERDYSDITKQIRDLAENGHGMGLHVHPHWEDSHYDGEKWVFDTSRYKLADFDESSVMDIITRYNEALRSASGQSPIAYRAGGWSAQPFSPIGKALKRNGIYLDSSVYPGGKYISDNQSFDFSAVRPYTTHYRFQEDLTTADPSGEFTEIPISAYSVSPLFYWKFLYHKFTKKEEHKAFGDGHAIALSRQQALRLLAFPSHSVVSIDGFKASLIEKAFASYGRLSDEAGNFVLIGHPKAFSSYSLDRVAAFIRKTHSNHTYKTMA